MNIRIKIIYFISILIVSFLAMSFQSKSKLYRIEKSNFFTDNTNVYYAVTNKMNSSGMFMSIPIFIDTLTINGKIKDNFYIENVELISRKKFFENYKFDVQYFSFHKTIAIKLPKVRLKDFEVKGANYGICNNDVFYKLNKIKNAKSASFSVILDDYHQALSKDDTSVFYRDKIIEKANPNTLTIIDDNGKFLKDTQHVFAYGKLLEGADPASFKKITYTYQQDKSHVWAIGKPTEIDRKTFKLLNRPNSSDYSSYAIDKAHVYFQGEILIGANPRVFTIINDYYCRDDKHIYYSGEIVEGADVASFKIIEYAQAKDKNNKYSHGRRIKS